MKRAAMIRILKFAAMLALVSVLYCLGVFLSWTILVPAVLNALIQIYVEMCLAACYVMGMYIIVSITRMEWKDK